jgi:RNA 3'-terminal phosphate cyclase
MALAGGGTFHTTSLTRHTRTNLGLIERFLPIRFTVHEASPGVHAIQAQ